MRQRTKVHRRTLLTLPVLLWAAAAVAQEPVTQTTSGMCSPNIAFVGGDVVFSPSCPVTITREFNYTLSDRETLVLAEHYHITETAVANFFARLGLENVAPYEVPARFEELVIELEQRREAFAAIELLDEAEAMRPQYLQALSDGDLDACLHILEEMTDRTRSVALQSAGTIRDHVALERERANLLLQVHKYDAAYDVLDQSIELLPAMFRLDHAKLRVDFARAAFLKGGQPGDILTSAQLAVDATDSLAAVDPVLRVRALSGLLHAYWETGAPEKAAALFRAEVDPLLSRPEVRAHPEALFCFACLGGALSNAGQYDEAAAILRRGIEFGEELLVPDRVGLAAIYNNLYVAVSDKEDGLRYLDRSKELILAAFPNGEHPNYVFNLINRAKNTEDIDRSFELALEAADLRLRLLGFSGLDPAILSVVLFHGSEIYTGYNRMISRGVLRPAGQIDIGRAFLEERLQELYPDAAHPEVSASLGLNYGNTPVQGLYLAEADYEYSKVIDAAATKGETRWAGTAHFMRGQILWSYTNVPLEEVEPDLRAALEIYERTIGLGAHWTFDARQVLTDFLVKQNRVAEAREILEAAKASCRSPRCEGYDRIAGLEQMIPAE